MQGSKILIVEDERSTAAYLQELLESQRFNVPGVVYSGEDAIRVAEKSKPDLVLMDIKLEGKMDGITAARSIRKMLDIPIIFLSGFCDHELSKRALKSCPTAYILKPFNERELKINIDLALDAYHRKSTTAEDPHELDLCDDYYDGLVCNENCELALNEQIVFAEHKKQALLKKIDELNVTLRHKINQRTQELAQTLERIKQANKSIDLSLREKEILLKEMHHRFKNNMAIISSLLGLEKSRVSSKKARDALQESQNRVQTLARIHETLYGSKTLTSIKLKTYLSQISSSLIGSYSAVDKVKLVIKGRDVSIGAKQASSLGLIVNELITNALKYAFPADRKGEIKLHFKRDKENQAELTVSDNGIGLPPSFDIHQVKSLGLTLVNAIAEDQLNGSVTIKNKNGVTFQIRFDLDDLQQRGANG